MAEIISFHGNPSPEELKENPLKELWSLFSSLDKFTKEALIFFLLIILITPVITSIYLDLRQRAAGTTTFFEGEISSQPIPDELLLKFKLGISEETKKKLHSEYELKVLETIPQINVERVTVLSEKRDETIKTLKEDARIEYAEKDFVGKVQIIPNDPAIKEERQWNLLKINAPVGWEVAKGDNLVVAVIDSGIDTSHEEFVGKIIPGYNFVENNNDMNDALEHGTAVSGIIGALTDNGKGIASLGWNIKIMPIKVVNQTGHVFYSNAAKAIIFAADNKANVINLSWGGINSSNVLQDAINYAWNKGLVLVAAVGNQGKNKILFPAAANNVITVGATNKDDIQAVFSNSGPELDVMAPGIDIYTTATNNTYKSFSGTSIASAHVAALASLILSYNPMLINRQIVDIISSATNNSGSGQWNRQYGFGRIDSLKALEKAKTTAILADTTLPFITIVYPSPDDILSGLTDFKVSANDDVLVEKVEFLIDGKPFVTDHTFPYLASWDTATVENGVHTISANAYDQAGNISFPSSIEIEVKN